MKLFDKKLGSCYLVELRQDNNFYYIQLYKKWNKKALYEATDYIIKIDIKNSDKALSIYNGVNLKNMYKVFEENEK